ncbi:type II toxin-antitoxin system RelE family toxin [Paenibacillus eucommiae]|uniref:Addiction module RelE/StbE family toxin n=1 Tax=Paenibacillus eucommiae TaxID=1355755 RepID=A0ABS4J8H7_9BACL|nr:type II toxin-antitoxin system mRNA interferase toxin, RelE/StbE family [Paenibacillus eucommiae]MBP1996133.1 addiction module RelE/StbE family toxin [Paenibacillus eucommiae]
MFELNISNQAKKDLKRLDKSVIKEVLSILESIAENPHAGEPLHGNLTHLKKWSFTHLGVGYRIAYQIFEEHIEVKIMQIGTRENFYDELKRRNR